MVLLAGAVVCVAAYLVFGLGSSGWLAPLVGFVLAEIGIGMTETSESTFVTRHLPDRLRATATGCSA